MAAPKPPPGFSAGKSPQQQAAEERIKRLARQPGEQSSDGADLEPRALTLVEQRIEVVFTMMRLGKWRPGKSDSELAAAWNIGAEHVRKYAAEANRQIRRILDETTEDKKAVVADIRQFMHDISLQAREIGTPNALRVAVDAMDRYADYLGVKPSIKVQSERDPYAEWTDEELSLYLKDGTRPARKT